VWSLNPQVRYICAWLLRNRGNYATVSKSEQLPVDDLVRPKYVTIDMILMFKLKRDCQEFYVALKTEMNE
jgi:hypothetical protein